MDGHREADEVALKARVALLEKVIASLLINRRDSLRRAWVKEIFREEYFPMREMGARRADPSGLFYFERATEDVPPEAMEQFEKLVSDLATTEKLATEVALLRMDYLEMMAALSEAEALADVPMRRIVQTSVYISEGSKEASDILSEAVPAALDAMDCDVYIAEEPKTGSWFRRIWGRTKDVVTSDAVQDAAAKLERAAEIKILDCPQHDADLKAAKAVREILKGFEGSNEGIALIGSLCVLKRRGRVVAVTLTQEQLAEVRKNRALLSNPRLMEGLLNGETEYETLVGNEEHIQLPLKRKKAKAKESRLPKQWHAGRPG